MKVSKVFTPVCILGLVVVMVSCEKKEVPTVITTEITAITATTATSGGTINDEGSGTVVERGICWSEGTTPTIEDDHTLDGGGVGTFISIMDNLDPVTNYYVRAYAKNEAGIGYGMAMAFQTLGSALEVQDIDGNVYEVINIGTQFWMADNLKTTKYLNGDLIGTTTPSTLDLSSEPTPHYQWAYNGTESSVDTYGRLYTWYTVADNRGICPEGWHVPTDEEWSTLINFLSGELSAGGKMKEEGSAHWISPNIGATNSSGFTGLPGGCRLSSSFSALGDFGYFWSKTASGSTSAWIRELDRGDTKVRRMESPKMQGFSVRCIKDN